MSQRPTTARRYRPTIIRLARWKLEDRRPRVAIAQLNARYDQTRDDRRIVHSADKAYDQRLFARAPRNIFKRIGALHLIERADKLLSSMNNARDEQSN